MKNKVVKPLVIICLVFLLVISTNVSFDKIYSLPNDFIVSYEEIKEVNVNKKFGSLVTTNIEKSIQNVSNEKDIDGIIVFKLFGFIPIRKVNVKLAPEEDVYVGGVPVGLSITGSGAIIVEEKEVDCLEGERFTEKTERLKKGDIIYEVNGLKINCLEDIKEVVEDSKSDIFEIKFKRKNRDMKSIVKGEYDKNNNLKLGLLVKDDISGVGTLTYVNTKTNKFGALGHAITDEENIVEVSNGKLYNCSLLDIQKGQRNNPGQLKCVFMQSGGFKGEIEKNNKYGVFGSIKEKSEIIDENLTLKIGGRLSVTPGKAKIISSVSGIREEYEIEIIKANYQSTADDKSIVFRVTDERLLKLTGGIVQGMSGSPIIQNKKIIGAVTHVFISDPTKGYGVYSDWMLMND